MKNLIRATLDKSRFPDMEWLGVLRHPWIPPGESVPDTDAIRQADELAGTFMSYLQHGLQPRECMLITSTSPRISGGVRGFIRRLEFPVVDTPHLLEDAQGWTNTAEVVVEKLDNLVHSGIKVLFIVAHRSHTEKLASAMFPGCPVLPDTKMAAGYLFDLRTKPATYELIEHPDAKADHQV